MPENDLKQALDRALECFNDPARRDQYLAGYAEDVAIHGYPPELPPGKGGITAFYQMAWNAFPDAIVTAEQVVAAGDRVAALYRLRGTHKGDFMGVLASGNAIDVTGMTILRYESGKIVERWQMLDQLTLLQQLGAIPVPAAV
jgi:steroid delta-isomerase-like uncharacterized protein